MVQPNNFSTPFDDTIVVGVAVFLVVDLALDLIVVLMCFYLLLLIHILFCLINVHLGLQKANVEFLCVLLGGGWVGCAFFVPNRSFLWLSLGFDNSDYKLHLIFQ